jgi:dihydropteroate synthase
MGSLAAWLTRLPTESGLGTAFARLAAITRAAPASSVGGRTFAWGTRTFVMGVLNVTPDSFSDGGRFAEPAAAIAHAQALLAAGADLLDVGGESTRPGAVDVAAEVELARVLPVIEGLKKVAPGAVISIDTRKARVAEAALKAGAALVNDVGGLRDDAMLELLATTGAAACVMHMKGSPQTMQADPRYEDVGGEVLDALEESLRRAEARGIPRARLWVDPGIGFGKKLPHNLMLLRRANDLRLLGCPVLIGVSRKKFLGELTGQDTPRARVISTAAAVALVAGQGSADVVRVHDVAAAREALAVADAWRRG